MANRGTDPDAVVTNARARRLGVLTQAEQQADLRSQMRTGDTGDTASRYVDGDMIIDGGAEVHGQLIVRFDDDTNAFVVNTNLSGVVGFEQGIPVVFFTDQAITETARIDAATGNITTIGTINGVAISGTGAILVKLDSATAFRVQVAAGNNIFVVNTNAGAGVVAVEQGAPFVLYSDQATTEKLRLAADTGHIRTSGTAPTIVAGAAAGTTPTVAVVGTDLGMRVQVTTGTSPATGTLCTVTVANAMASTGFIPVLGFGDSDAAVGAAKVYIDSSTITTTTFDIKVTGAALPASTSHFWFIHIIDR